MKEYKLKINGEIDFIIISPQVLSSLISQILLLKRVIMKLMGNVMHIHIFSLYTYNDMDELIDVCVKNMVNEDFTEEQARSYLKDMLPKLDYWKRYDELSDNGQFAEFKKQLINEINDLHIDGLPRVDKINALVGKYVNLEYTLPNGQKYE